MAEKRISEVKLRGMQEQVEQAQGKTKETTALLEDAVKAAMDAHAMSHRKEQETSTLRYQVSSAQEHLHAMRHTNQALEEEVLRLRAKAGYGGSAPKQTPRQMNHSGNHVELMDSAEHALRRQMAGGPWGADQVSTTPQYTPRTARAPSSHVGANTPRGYTPNAMDQVRMIDYHLLFCRCALNLTVFLRIFQAFTRADLNSDGVLSRG